MQPNQRPNPHPGSPAIYAAYDEHTDYNSCCAEFRALMDIPDGNTPQPLYNIIVGVHSINRVS